MSRRGVFLFLLFFVSLTSVCYGVEIKGELMVAVGSAGFERQVELGLRQQWSRYQLELGWHKEDQQRFNWHIAKRGQDTKLALGKNVPHFTSEDAFRLVDKNNFSSSTIVFWADSPQFQAALFSGMPLRSLDMVGGKFYRGQLHISQMSLSGSHLDFSGYREVGEAQVVDAAVKNERWAVLGALGWQTDTAGRESKAKILRLEKKRGFLQGILTLQRIDPGFWSPLAKTNKYVPDRTGWQLELKHFSKQLNSSLNIRQHSNISQSREYNQLSLTLAAADKGPSLQWRFQPTSALIVRYQAPKWEAWLDVLNWAGRYGREGKLVEWDVRFDWPREVIRVEFKAGVTLAWRVVAKYDFKLKRHNYAAQFKYIKSSSEIQLELGHYDKGNFLAGFNQVPSFRISWAWRF